MQTIRLFIALELSSFIKGRLNALQQRLGNDAYFNGALIPREQLHCTVAFIGKRPSSDLQPIKEQLSTLQLHPFELCLETLELIMQEKQRGLIWVTVHNNDLENVMQAVHSVLTLDTPSNFVGHITLARIKRVKNIEFLKKHLEELNRELINFNDNCFMVNSLVLKESRLHQNGSHYIDHACINF